MLIRWIKTSVSAAEIATSPSFAGAHIDLVEFAKAVQALADDKEIKDDALRTKMRELATAALADKKLSKTARGRAYLIEHWRQSRAILARLVKLPLQAALLHGGGQS